MIGFGKKRSKSFDLNDDFIDREVQQYSFKRHLIETSRTNGKFLLIYSGVGRVGKTSLLEQLKKIVVAGFYKNFICVCYNFDNNEFTQADDMLVTLKTLRASLTKKYRVEFPLFDKGCIYLAQKSGEFVSAEQQRSVMKSSAVLRGFKAHLNSMKSKTDEAVTVTKILNNLFDSTGEFLSDVSNTSLVLKSGKYFVDFLDGVIAAREEKARAEGDKSYGELLAELNKLNGEDAPAPVREILPRLFAKDLSYWLDENKKTLIIFLDAYEKLTGEEQGKKKYGRLISENRDVPVDWWVGDLLTAERVMWVIAGRYQIKEIGEINLESQTVENYTVDVFDKNSSNKYLQLQGIEEAELHTAIINLTGGHPYYLRKCAETYKNYKDKGKVPRPSDFGKNLDDIVEKTVGSLDESGQLMTQCLCILKTWTDEVAADVIPNFSNVTYKRVKKMVARAEQLSFDDETGFTFDKTIDSFLFPALKRDVTCRKLFTDIRDAANVYFKKFFAETVRYYDSKQNYYFGIWSEIILRTMDAPADLMKFYYENFEPLEKRFDCSTPEIVVQKFFNKVGDDKTLPSAYFQSRFAFVRYLQNRDKEIFKLLEAAYYKVEKLSLSKDELPFKISIMTVLALSFSWLSRSKDEIKLREEIVRDCEKCFSAKDDRIIEAKENLACALDHGDRQNDALKIRQQIFKTFDEDDGERYIKAADAFARALKGKAAFPIRRKIVELYEKNNDDENICSELYTLINLLSNLSGEEYLEEKAERFSQYVALCKKLGEKISYGDLVDFADTLKELGRAEEAEEFLESQTNDLKKQIESCDEPDSETLELIINLVDLLEDTDQDEEAERWREKINETVQAIIKRYTAEPIADFDAALSKLRYCSWSISYEQEKIDLKRAILSLSEKKPGVEDFEIIVAKEDLIDSLKSCEENIEEVNQLFEEIESYHRKNLPASRTEFVKTLCDYARFLKYELDDSSAAMEKLKEALDYFEKDSETPANEILDMMNEIADAFDSEEDYSEEKVWRERIWNFCKEHFLEDADETLNALNDLCFVYEELEEYGKAEQCRRQFRDIRERNFGSFHIETIWAIGSLADTLHKAGKYGEELVLREQIVDLYRKNFSENSNNKRRHIFNFREAREILAIRLDEAGQESKALTIRKEIATEQKERLKELKENSADDDDLTNAINDVIEALESLAESYSKYSRTNEALETYREILENYSLEPEEVDDIQEKIAALTQTAAPEEQPSEIDVSESLTLSRGQRVPLTKNNPALNKLTIDFRWEDDADLEIDASAFLLGADGKAHADEDFIFYGNSEHQSGSVKYSSDGAQASMRVELKRIPDEVARISFTLTIYEAEERRQNFGCVKVFTRVIDEAAQKEIFRFDLQEGFSVETAIVVGEIYRHKGEWKFNAVGAGFTGGLVALCKNFGVEVN